MCSLFCFKDQTSFFEFTPLYGLYQPNYSGKQLLDIYKKLYPNEWRNIEERFTTYSNKNTFLVSVGKKKRYEIMDAESFFFSLQIVKYILSSGFRKKHTTEYKEEKRLNNEKELYRIRKEKIDRYNKKINSNIQNMQMIEPLFIDALICAYHSKNNSVDDKMEIFKEITKYSCKKTTEFCFKVNDSERNDQVRGLAFSFLQKTGHYAKLRPKFDGKKKNYMIATTDFNVTPEDLAKELMAGNTVQNMKSYDIFISHSSLDEKIIRNIIHEFNKVKILCYCDWTCDNDFLKRTMVSDYTKEVLKYRMIHSKSLIYVCSNNSRKSEWVKWEIEYYKTLSIPMQ